MFGSKLSRVRSTPGACTFAGPGIALARFWARTLAPEIKALREALAVAAQGADGIALLVVVDADAPAPGRASREALGQLYAEYSDRFVAWAGCVRGSGLGATSKRTMMRVVMAIGRIRCPWVVEGEALEAAAWLAEQTQKAFGEPGDRDAWLAHLEGARPSEDTADTAS